ncbi:MAG: caspase family protein, partial [Thermoplasmatales archaeon]|nr:caspase family protein [Thermoplasmatales archaeon]
MKIKKMMIYLVLAGLCLLMFISNAVSPEADIKSDEKNVNKYALLIGIEDYPPGVKDLDYTIDDVYDMCDVLINNCYFPPENIRVLTDTNATKENIQNNITWIASNAKQNDTVFFFFSGHGGHDYVLVYGDTISDNELDLWFTDINSTNLVIIIDSCYAGSMIEKSKTGCMDEVKNFSYVDGVKNENPKKVGDFAKGLGQDGRIVLAACAENQYSQEYDELSNGVFTYYLTGGLKSALADTNGNGWVSAEEAFYYAKPRTYQFNNSENPAGGQDPQIYDGIEGELDISSLTPTGDLIVDDKKTYSSIPLPLNKNLTITGTGNLTLNNVILMMNSSFNGEHHIEVQSGGQLYIYNSNISSVNDYHYLFWVRNNSRFEMRNSELHGCGYEMLGEDYSHSGLWINTNNVKLYNNIFSGNYVGLCFYVSENSSIINSTISNSTQYDICIKNSTLYALNTTFNKTSVFMMNSTITVSWYLNVNVTWKNNISAEYANVTIMGSLMVEVFNDLTNENGCIKNIVLQENYQSPYLITASKNGYYGSETVEMNQNMEITVYLEDIMPPDADAGNDQEIDINVIIYFDGSNSTDNSGIIENYTWTFADNDVEVTLYGISPNYTFHNPGVFVVMLNVTDGSGNRDTDTVNIRVKDRMPPNANAGNDQEIDINVIIYFDGSNSTDNVGVVNYTWTFFDNSNI